MVSDRLQNYKEFASHMEYPMVLFSGNTGNIIEANYEAQTILGQNISKIIMKTDKFMYSEDFWGQLHRKKSLIWHRILLLVDGKRHVVSGFVNEFEIDGEIIYMVLFELRADMNIGSVTLERIVNHADILAIYLYKVEEEWKIRYISKNVNQYGYTTEQFYNGDMDMLDVIFEDDRALVQASIDTNIKTKIDQFEFNFRVISESQELIPVNATMRVVRDSYGISDGLEIIINDLRKENAKEVERLYYEKAFERIKSISMVKHYRGDERKLTFISPNAILLGMNPVALKQGYKLTEDYIHPEDRDWVVDRAYGAIEKGVNSYSMHYRMVGDDGEIRHVNNEVTITRISEDEAEINYLITDITEHKIAEEKLLASKQTLERQFEYLMYGDNKDFKDETEMLGAIGIESLEEILESLSNITNLYMAVVDNEGVLITKPFGPMDNMGYFYDMFERPFYRDKYIENNAVLSKTKEGLIVDMDNDGFRQRVSMEPIIIKNKHIATWLICAYTDDDMAKIEEVAKTQKTYARMVSQYIYYGIVNRREIRNRRIAQVNFDIEKKERAILQDITKHIYSDDMKALDYTCERAGRYLNINSLSILKYNQEKNTFIYVNSWASSSRYVIKNYDVDSYQEEFKQVFRRTIEEGTIVLSSNQIREVANEIYLNSDTKAVISLVIKIDDKPFGIVNFVEGNAYREWKDREVKFAKCIRDIITGIVIRREVYNSTNSLNTSLLNSYNMFSEYVFVKDRYSDIVLYSNNALNKAIGYNFVGRDSKEILVSGNDKIGSIGKRIVSNKKELNWQKYIKQFDKNMNITEIKIEWLDGRKAVLVVLKEA